MTAINQQTRGPLCSHLQLGDTGPQPLYSTNVGGNLVALPIKDNEDLRLKAGKRKPATERDIATQRLLAAAYTAFDGVGRHPEINGDAAMMAEALGADGLVEMIKIVKWAAEHADSLGASAPNPIKDIGDRAASIMSKLHRCR
jgi:hypothetical protein